MQTTLCRRTLYAADRAGGAVCASVSMFVVASVVAWPGWWGELDGQAAWSPGSGRGVEHAGDRRAAVRAPALGGELVGAQAVPVALDQQLAAVVAVGALAGGVAGVAGVGVTDAVVQGDVPGPGQRGRWG